MDRLSELRKQNNLRQQDVAEATGLNLTTLQKWEQKYLKLEDAKLKSVKILADFYGVSIDYLMGWSDEN